MFSTRLLWTPAQGDATALQREDMKGSTVKYSIVLLPQSRIYSWITESLGLRPVTVNVELVVVVGASTWYIKEFHPLIPWQIGEILGTMGFPVQSG